MKPMIKTVVYTEETFFEEHEKLKAAGARLLKCVEVSGHGERQYHLTFVL